MRRYDYLVVGASLFGSIFAYEANKRNKKILVRKILQRTLERAECKHVRFHDLRHTFATTALANGMDVKTLSAMIGHISAETTLNIYTHITDIMQRNADNKIERCFGKNEGSISEDEQTLDQTRQDRA